MKFELDIKGAYVFAFVTHFIRSIVYLVMFVMAFFSLPILSVTLSAQILAWAAVFMIIMVAVKPKNTGRTERFLVWFELPVSLLLLVVGPAYGLEIGQLMGLFFLALFLYNFVMGIVAYAEYSDL